MTEYVTDLRERVRLANEQYEKEVLPTLQAAKDEARRHADADQQAVDEAQRRLNELDS